MEEPSFRPGFNAYRTWRGAAWMNTAWLLIGGLRALGADDEADRARPGPPPTPSSAAASASTTTRAPAPATASTASAGRRSCSTSRPGFPPPPAGVAPHGVKLLVVTPEPIDAAFLRETLGDEVQGAEVLVALARHQPVQARVLGLRPRRRDRRGRDRQGPTRSSGWRRKASTPRARWENPSRRRPSTTRWPPSPPTAS